MLGTGKLAALKSDLRSGKSDELVRFLAHEADADDLRILREQKLLLIPANLQQQTVAAEAYKLAVCRLLKDEDASQACNYADFTSMCAQIIRVICDRLSKEIVHLRRLSKREILALIKDILAEFGRGLARNRSAALENHAKGPIREQCEISEYLLHQFNGLNNDFHGAAFRALNELMKVVQDSTMERLTRREQEDARNEFVRLISLGLAWNGWQYLLDKVTYGEWNVAEISNSGLPEVKFSLADIILERAKLLGIRRRISYATLRITKKSSKELEPFENFGVSCATLFVAHYLRRPVTSLDTVELDHDFRPRFKMLLTFFEQSDDLLIGASLGDFGIVGEYYIALLLRAWALGRRKAASMSHKGQRARIRESALPVDVCKQIARRYGWPEDDFERALESQTTALPTGSYFELVMQPFPRFAGDIQVIESAVGNDWPAPIRSRLIRGGDTAKRYGGLWEDCCARMLHEFRWQILGRNIKVRSGAQIVTDIDILALKADLLLVIQFKALGIGAATVYEHWLARSKIIRGAEQARLAIRELVPGSEYLRALLSNKKVNNLPSRVQPLIITNAEIFTGWNPKGVPVASLETMVSVLSGATVNHTTTEGIVVSTERLIRGEEPDSDEFLRFLDAPLDWRMAAEAEQVHYRVIKTEFGICSLPQLVRPTRPAANVEFCGTVLDYGCDRSTG